MRKSAIRVDGAHVDGAVRQDYVGNYVVFCPELPRIALAAKIPNFGEFTSEVLKQEGPPEQWEGLKLGAGVGFEPTTFRL